MRKEITRQNTTKIFNLNRSLGRRIFMGAALLFIFMLLSVVSFAQITLTDIRDTYIDNATPTSNFGSGNSLKVSYSQVTQGQTTTYNYQNSMIEFDRTRLPTNLSANDVVRATLKLYVNKVNVTAPFGVHLDGVCNTFDENTVTWNTASNSCVNGGNSQAITTANQYVTIDVTVVIRYFLTTARPNFTFLIVPNPPVNVAFDGKESGGNPPVLELELVKVNSVTGTDGLTGGGNDGNLLLSILDGGVTTRKIADGAVTSSKIANGAVGNAQLANNSVNTNNIAPGAVNNLQLADNSVTSNKIISGAVTVNQLSSGSVTETKLADGSVTSAKIADGSISGSKIAANSVGTSQIANGAVGTGQLGVNAVTSDKIASGQVVKTLNGLTDNVNLVAGNNVTITPSGNSLTISATSGNTQQTPAYNPQQVALKRWYSANQSGASVSLGGSPYGVAFDGSSIWVSNAANNNVSKVRASDGTVLGTYQVGSNPRLVEFDGVNIWVANFGSNTVTKLSASDGTVLATITVGNNPWGLVFDGTNMWVACYGSSLVYKLRAGNGQILGTVPVANPLGLAFDGTNIWAANNLYQGKATKIAGTGTPQVMGEFPAGVFPGNIVFDGSSIWVNNSGDGSLTRLRPSDGSLLGTHPIGYANVNGGGLAFDGTNLWLAGESFLRKIRISDGAVIDSFQVTNVGAGIAFDGANIWVANAGAGTVTKH
jgi:YVTN family beta-propeller protein